MCNLGINGFYHERPSDYTIYVAGPMKAVIEKWWAINGHVEFAFYDRQGFKQYYVEWEGKGYVAEERGQGADYYYQIVAEATEDRAFYERLRTYRAAVSYYADIPRVF